VTCGACRRRGLGAGRRRQRGRARRHGVGRPGRLGEPVRGWSCAPAAGGV